MKKTEEALQREREQAILRIQMDAAEVKRQQIRHSANAAAFSHVSKKFDVPRKQRRLIARVMAKKAIKGEAWTA